MKKLNYIPDNVRNEYIELEKSRSPYIENSHVWTKKPRIYIPWEDVQTLEDWIKYKYYIFHDIHSEALYYSDPINRIIKRDIFRNGYENNMRFYILIFTDMYGFIKVTLVPNLITQWYHPKVLYKFTPDGTLRYFNYHEDMFTLAYPVMNFVYRYINTKNNKTFIRHKDKIRVDSKELLWQKTEWVLKCAKKLDVDMSSHVVKEAIVPKMKKKPIKWRKKYIDC